MAKVMIASLLLFFIHSSVSAFVYHPFDQAMQREKYQSILQSAQARGLYQFFKQQYETLVNIKTYAVHLKIPKIIHQIWIGDSLPVELQRFVQTWRDMHPGWQYRLWTQEDILSFGFKNYRHIAASRNPGEISDLMRYEILYRYGGVYIDTDFECLQPLDELNSMYDFYVGIQPLDSGMVQLGIGLIGSVPGHPILQAAIDGLDDNLEQIQSTANIPLRTGPLYFTTVFQRHAGQYSYHDIALPACYFYPLGSQETKINKDGWLQAGAYGIHHWAKTWLLPVFRRPEFQSISNVKKR